MHYPAVCLSGSACLQLGRVSFRFIAFYSVTCIFNFAATLIKFNFSLRQSENLQGELLVSVNFSLPAHFRTIWGPLKVQYIHLYICTICMSRYSHCRSLSWGV